MTLLSQTVLWNTVAVECQGDGDLLKNLRIKNILNGEERDLAVNGLFYAIGAFLMVSSNIIPLLFVSQVMSLPRLSCAHSFKRILTAISSLFLAQRRPQSKVYLLLVMSRTRGTDKQLLALEAVAWLLWKLRS